LLIVLFRGLGPQVKAGLSPAVARLGKLKLTPHPKGRLFCGISFSLSKRAELALAVRAMMHPARKQAVCGILQAPPDFEQFLAKASPRQYKEAIPRMRAELAGLQ
jgi:hypothetical protein